MQTDSGLDAHVAKERLLLITRKHWFSEEYVRLGDYLRGAQDLFEAGVVLGYSFRDRLSGLSDLLCPAFPGAESIGPAGTSSAGKVSLVESERSGFLELFFKPEAECWINHLREDGRTRRSGWKALLKLDRKKVGIPETFAGLRLAFRKGIDLGGHHPLLADSLFTAFPNPETWACFRGRHSQLPAIPPDPKPFEIREFEAKSLILPYVEEHRPDHLARLGLWPSAGSDVRLRMRALRARMSPRPTTQS